MDCNNKHYNKKHSGNGNVQRVKFSLIKHHPLDSSLNHNNHNKSNSSSHLSPPSPAHSFSPSPSPSPSPPPSNLPNNPIIICPSLSSPLTNTSTNKTEFLSPDYNNYNDIISPLSNTGIDQSLIDMANSEGKIVKRNCSRCKESKKYVKSLNSKVSRIEDLVNSLAKSVQDTLVNNNNDRDQNMQTNQQTLPEILINGQNLNTIDATNNHGNGNGGNSNEKNRATIMPFNRIAINKRDFWNYSVEDLIKLVYNVSNYVTSQQRQQQPPQQQQRRQQQQRQQ